MHFEDFPILLETWRTCFQDEFDLVSLKQVLTEIETGVIRISEAKTASASPFAQSAAWRQVNQYMYSRDDPKTDRRSNLNTDLLKEVVFDQSNRPAIPRDVIERFERKRRRLEPGYAPGDADEMLDWVVERVFLPESELNTLLDRGEETVTTLSRNEILEPIREKILRIKPEWARETLIVATENALGLAQFFDEAPYHAVDEQGDPDSLASIVGHAPDTDPSGWFATWLSFYGPVSHQEIQNSLGLAESAITTHLEDLLDSEQIIEGPLIEGIDHVLICDATNYEFLLRLKRAQATPPFEPLPIDDLALFLAQEQGFFDRGEDLEGFSKSLDGLLFYPAPAGLWESEIFPARMSRYQPPYLDSLMQEGEILWFGLEGQKICFAYHQDMDLWSERIGEETEIAETSIDQAVNEASGYQDFLELKDRTGLNSADLHNEIWEAVWRTSLTNDGFMALRKGVQNRFELPKAGPNSSARARRGRPVRSGRSHRQRIQGALPVAGRWYRPAVPEESDDLIDNEEQRKDRVRLLIDRYGILFRELLLREAEPFQWRSLFRTLRLMELSGELYSGYFFKEIPGPQFISPAAFRRLQKLERRHQDVFWISAVDPVSLCGLPIEALKGSLPRRVVSNHLVYRGSEVVMTSNRNGKEIEIRVKPEDEDLLSILSVFDHLLNRQFQPLNRIVIETINEESASRSNFLDSFRSLFDVVPDVKHVTLYRKYT
jgi:ATP-dependent Lhr-like helicase